MAVLFDKDKKEVMITCRDGCDNGLSIKFYDPYDGLPLSTIDKEDICWLSYVNGNFYRDQWSAWRILKEKFKRIWLIIRSKDIYYSDIMMNKQDFEEFKEFINSVEV